MTQRFFAHASPVLLLALAVSLPSNATASRRRLPPKQYAVNHMGYSGRLVDLKRTPGGLNAVLVTPDSDRIQAFIPNIGGRPSSSELEIQNRTVLGVKTTDQGLVKVVGSPKKTPNPSYLGRARVGNNDVSVLRFFEYGLYTLEVTEGVDSATKSRRIDVYVR